MTRSEKIDLLENFSTFLAANGYMDEDWRSEPPFAIDEFLRLTPSTVEPTAKGKRYNYTTHIQELGPMPDEKSATKEMTFGVDKYYNGRVLTPEDQVKEELVRERNRTIQDVIICIDELCPSAIYEMFKKEMYHHIEKLKKQIL